MTTRKFSSTSIETTLLTSLAAGATTATVATGTGGGLMGGVTLGPAVDGVYPDQFTVAIDVDTNNEEIVFVQFISSDTLTIVRGCAGTGDVSHTLGASVKHVLTSDDLNAFEAGLENNTTTDPVSGLMLMGG